MEASEIGATPGGTSTRNGIANRTAGINKAASKARDKTACRTAGLRIQLLASNAIAALYDDLREDVLGLQLRNRRRLHSGLRANRIDVELECGHRRLRRCRHRFIRI